MTPTQRSLAKLRADEWTVCIVEKWNPHAFIRQDAFGFGDLLAVKVGAPGATLIQTTSGPNVAARITKIKGIAEAGIWLAAGNRIEVHGWRKVGKAGERKRWECRVVEIQCSRLDILAAKVDAAGLYDAADPERKEAKPIRTFRHVDGFRDSTDRIEWDGDSVWIVHHNGYRKRSFGYSLADCEQYVSLGKWKEVTNP